MNTKAREVTIEQVGFSVRTYNCLNRVGVKTLGELADKTQEELLKVRNLGERNLEEIMDNTSPEQKKQNLTLESRKHLSIDGVKDIKSFDDLLVCLETNMGKMNVEGKQLKISKYLCNTGEMTIDGIIDAVIYFEDSQEKKSFFSRLAR